MPFIARLPGVIPGGAPAGGLQLCNMILKPGETITGDPSENTATVAGRYEPRDTTSLDPNVNDNYNYAPINYLLTPFEQASLFTQISHRVLDNVQFTGRALYNRHKTERHLAETPLLFGDLTFPPYNSIYIAADQAYNPFDQDIGTHAGQGTAALELLAELDACWATAAPGSSPTSRGASATPMTSRASGTCVAT